MDTIILLLWPQGPAVSQNVKFCVKTFSITYLTVLVLHLSLSREHFNLVQLFLFAAQPEKVTKLKQKTYNLIIPLWSIKHFTHLHHLRLLCYLSLTFDLPCMLQSQTVPSLPPCSVPSATPLCALPSPQVGDQILEVNGRSFLGIPHDEAVRVLKSSRHLMMTVKDVGRLPHARTVVGETKWIASSQIAESSANSSVAGWGWLFVSASTCQC